MPPVTAHPAPHPGAAALACARRGWHVFPLTPRGKKPARGFTDWETNATTDPARIRAFWTRGRYNVGIACGPSGLVVIDLDTPKPGQTPPAEWAQPGIGDGADVLAALCELAEQPFPTETFTVTTRRGGMHLYFTAPPGAELRNTSGRLGWLIDTRAHGGYVVAPGSLVDLPDGTGPYTVTHNVPPAPLPDWITHRLTPPSLECRPAPEVAAPSAYITTALQQEAQRVRTAVIGGRNHALNKAAYHLGQLIGTGGLTYDHAYEALYAAASAHFGPGHQHVTPDEAHATITSGLTAGTRRPRTLHRKEAA
ncbi:bifunctional DNA primase/polymerase [Actinomadura hibisca]|uniref:bifunctional DNA primase/polymerase n=1 Tax=Actinomadura hibisca TaxID=68565 RepID=UPI000831E3C5|nr:bifunctional DNA primase/polymerase [Actinomadura hibisca]